MPMKTPQSTGSFALCVENGGMEDLEARKVYQVRSRPKPASGAVLLGVAQARESLQS